MIRSDTLLGGLGLGAAGFLTACGAGGQSAPGASQSQADKGTAESGTLIVWGAVDPDLGPTNLIAAFTDKYPDIKVTYERFVNDEEGILKLDAALTGGVSIDVFFSYGLVDVARRSAAGLALDLTELARADETAKKFVAAEPISTLIDGKLFSIPTTHFPHLVVLNQDAVDKTGIDVPYDWTVDDYRALAQALKKEGFETGAYNTVRLAASMLGGDYLYKEGGAESNFDHPVFKEELELVLAMEDEGSIMTQERIAAEGIGQYAQNYFYNGSFAMMLDGTIAARYAKNLEEYPHDFKVAFRPYPKPTSGEAFFNPGVRGDDVQIAAGTQYPAVAWTFVKFWLEEGGPFMAPAGKVTPEEFENPTDDMFEQLFGPDAEKLFDVESFKESFFLTEPPLSVRTATKAFTEVSKIKLDGDAEVRLRTKTIDEALTEMKTKADAAIAKVS